MLERPLDLFPNNKIVDKTLITIEQIFAVHYEKPFSFFFRALQASQGEREQRAKGGGRGGGRGGKRRMLRRASLARRGSLRFSMLA